MSKKITYLLVVILLSSCHNRGYWKINTSSDFKYREIESVFEKHNISLDRQMEDLDEIDSDPVNVVVHKASQFDDYVLVEDTSMDVDGADIGVNLKWKANQLQYLDGKNAIWRVLAAYKVNQKVYVFKGEVHGKLKASEAAHDLNTMFVPEGLGKTLHEKGDNRYHPRIIAMNNVIHKNVYRIENVMPDWNGRWQSNTKNS